MIAFIAALAAVGVSEGAEWKLVAKGLTGVPLYYDAGSVIPAKETASVLVRTKAVFVEAETPVAGLEEYTHSLGLLEILCAEKMFIVRETVVYDKEGKSFTAYSPRWEYLSSEPQIEKLFEIVCD